MQWKRKTRYGEEKRAGSTPVARVDSNKKARCAREQTMDMCLQWKRETRDGEGETAGNAPVAEAVKRRVTERKRERAMHL